MDPDPWRALYAHLLSSMSEVKSDDLWRLRSRNLQGLRGLRRLRSLCVLVWSLDERLGRRHHGNHAEVVERETKAGCDAGATISPCCVPQRRYGPSRELEPMVDPLRLRARSRLLAGGNPSDYTLEGIDGVANAVDKATDLYTKMLSINTSSWIIGNRMRWIGLMALDSPGLRGGSCAERSFLTKSPA